MAIPLALDDVIEVVMRSTLHGSTCLNVMHYRVQTITVALSLELATDTVAGILSDAIGDISSAELTVDLATGQRIFPPPKTVQVQFPQGRVGSVVGQSLPSSVTQNVKKLTNLAGRSARGRIYLPGVPFVVEEDSRLSIVGLAALQNFAGILKAVVNTGNGLLQPVVFERASGGTTDITNAVADPILRNQRRRQPLRGI